MLLCEFILNSTRTPPGEEFLYHTLLELHLMGDEEQNPGLPRFANRIQYSCLMPVLDHLSRSSCKHTVLQLRLMG